MATYILFWNPAISSYNERHFVADFDAIDYICKENITG